VEEKKLTDPTSPSLVITQILSLYERCVLLIGEQGLKLDWGKAALGSWLGPIEEAQGRAAQANEV
jgi:hypothetical protein